MPDLDWYKSLEEYREKAERLEEYADLLHDEQGTAWRLLVQLFRHGDYVSDQMEEVVREEIDRQLERVDDEYEVVEEESTHSTPHLQYNP